MMTTWFFCKQCKSYRVTYKPRSFWRCQDCGAEG